MRKIYIKGRPEKIEKKNPAKAELTTPVVGVDFARDESFSMLGRYSTTSLLSPEAMQRVVADPLQTVRHPFNPAQTVTVEFRRVAIDRRLDIRAYLACIDYAINGNSYRAESVIREEELAAPDRNPVARRSEVATVVSETLTDYVMESIYSRVRTQIEALILSPSSDSSTVRVPR